MCTAGLAAAWKGPWARSWAWRSGPVAAAGDRKAADALGKPGENYTNSCTGGGKRGKSAQNTMSGGKGAGPGPGDCFPNLS